MEIPIARARSLFAAARVARLATADADGRPHLVPVTFVVEGESVYFAVDAKPKRSQHLRRLRNIEANPQVSLLVDEYDEDWERLWWVRADGAARIHRDGLTRIIELLRAKYTQYATVEVGHGPIVEIAVGRWAGWRSSARS